MLNNKDQFKTAFLPYLSLFLERAKSERPELTHVQVPDALQAACNKIGVTLKTSFGMGTPTVIPWLACFLPGQTAGKDGVYPVILYRRDTNTLSVCYGVSAAAQATEGNWPRKWPAELVARMHHFGHDKYGASYEFRFYSEKDRGDTNDIADAFATVIENFLSIPLNRPSNLEPFLVDPVDLSTLLGDGKRALRMLAFISKRASLAAYLQHS